MRDTALRLESSVFRIKQFLKQNVTRIAKSVFEPELKRNAIILGLTEKQLRHLNITSEDNTLVVKMKYHGPTRSNYIRERWWIEPIGSGSLSANLPKALSWVSNGRRFFSKGHYITGINGKIALSSAVRLSVPKFTESVKKETEAFMERNKIW